MAEIITGSRPIFNVPDQAAANKEVAAKLEAQGKPEAGPKPQDLEDTRNALDKLAAEKSAEKEGTPPPKDQNAPQPDVTPKPPAPTAEEKKAAEEAAKVAEEKAKWEAKANDLFKNSPSLPDRASPKSSEAFSAIKIKAAQDISERDSKIETLTKELEDLKKTTATAKSLDPETEKELAGLREWRSKMDVDFDPKFKAFDKKISDAQEFIYAQLRKSPKISDKTIKEIQSYGGPENVNMTQVFDAIKDPTIQNIVQSKIADIEASKFEKQRAIDAAKSNVNEYLAERQREIAASTDAHRDIAGGHVNNLVSQFEWFKPREAKDGQTDAEKADIKSHNDFVAQTQSQLTTALNDNTPEMRAILLTGMVKLFYVQRQNAAQAQEIDKLKAANKELSEKWDKVRSAQTSRLAQSAAPTGGTSLPKADPEKAQFNTNTRSALDEIAKNIMETRAAAGK